MSTDSHGTDELDTKDLRRFFEASHERFRRLPANAGQSRDTSTRAAAIGLTAAAANYLLIPELLRINRDASSLDEFSSFFVLLAGLFFGSIHKARALCEDYKKGRRTRRMDALKATGGGASIGAGIAAVLPFILTGPPGWLLGGVILGGAAVGGGAMALANRKAEPKTCTNRECGKDGICSQRVCRHCFRLFYPEGVDIDCSKKRNLDWYTIASYLAANEGFSYFDTYLMVEENISKWKRRFTADRDLRIDCRSFMQWLEQNPSAVAKYIGSAKKKWSVRELQERLDNELDKMPPNF